MKYQNHEMPHIINRERIRSRLIRLKNAQCGLRYAPLAKKIGVSRQALHFFIVTGSLSNHLAEKLDRCLDEFEEALNEVMPTDTMDRLNKAIGEGLSLSQVAGKAGISHSYLSNRLKQRRITIEQARRILPCIEEWERSGAGALARETRTRLRNAARQRGSLGKIFRGSKNLHRSAIRVLRGQGTTPERFHQIAKALDRLDVTLPQNKSTKA